MYNTVTLLKNSCGMHILQNIKRELELNAHREYSWDEIVGLSMPALQGKDVPIFDPNCNLLYHPDSMLGAIGQLTGLRVVGDVIASAYRSLAVSYRVALADLEKITGETYDTIHIIGGGARNDHLNQMTANETGKRVVTGPEEATSLGVVAVQILHDHPELTLQDLRRVIRDSVSIGVYEPGGSLRPS